METKQEKESLPQMKDSAELLSINSDPKSYLESHDFTVTNGLAGFKLEEAAENDCNVTSSSYSDDEKDALSFVVLGKDSLDSIQQSSLASYVDIQQKSMSIDYDSIIASWDSTEVHDKLNELLQENTKLKETLKQHNIAMKQQFNTLATWQEEIMKVYQSHKKKFAETRELINYLKKENTQLKMRLANLPSYSQIEHEILDACSEESIKEKEIFNLNGALNQLDLCKLNELCNENAREETTALKDVHTIPDSDEQATEKRSLEEERIALNKERESLEAEKKLVDIQKKNIENEYKHLNDAKALLEQEKINLEKERSSLGQPSPLNETHYKSILETEKAKYEQKYAELVNEIDTLKDCINFQQDCVKVMTTDAHHRIDWIEVLETQLKLYEEDFNQEKRVRDFMVKEKNMVIADLHNQLEHNKQLERKLNCANVTSNVPPNPIVHTLLCPICYVAFNDMDKLQVHIDVCLDSSM